MVHRKTKTTSVDDKSTQNNHLPHLDSTIINIKQKSDSPLINSFKKEQCSHIYQILINLRTYRLQRYIDEAEKMLKKYEALFYLNDSDKILPYKKPTTSRDCNRR